MEENNYKQDIIATRIGGLGSSDAKMVAKVGQTGVLNYQAQERIGQMLGQVQRRQFSTAATRLGDEMENRIFAILKGKYPEAVSNPFYQDDEMTQRYGFGIFTHIDYEVDTDTELIWFECKACKGSTDTIEDNYIAQLAWHYMLGTQKARLTGKKKFSLYLIHYDTEDYDGVFSAQRLSISNCNRRAQNFIMLGSSITEGLRIIADTVAAGFVFTPKEVLNTGDLPEDIQREMDIICQYVLKLKEAEDELDRFKEKLLPIMEQNHIDIINNPYFTITYRRPSVRATFDSKAFQKEHPDIYENYIKQSNVKSSLTIKAI